MTRTLLIIALLMVLAVVLTGERKKESMCACGMR